MAVEFLGYQWFFGDGSTSEEQNPSHTYNMPGTYNWECLAIFSNGVVLTESGTIKVYSTSYDYDKDPGGDPVIIDADGNITTGDGEVLFAGIMTSRTDKCYRMAVPQKIEQGIGWSEYDGVDFPFPVGEIGHCRVKDENEDFRPLVIDGRTFQVHEMGREDQWLDGEDDYAGTEIESSLLLKEEVPPMGAAAILQHEQSHAYIKPWINTRRSSGQYNAEGFRANFNMDALVRVNGLPTNHAITQKIPFRGQLIFDRICKSPNLQIGWILRGAPWRFVRTQTWYRQIDSAAAPTEKTMTEETWSREWYTPLIWQARNVDYTIDFARGVAIPATFLGVTTGPDGFNGSAVVTGATGSFFYTGITIGTDFTVNVWLRNLTTMTLYTIGNLTISVAQVLDDWILTWNDGITTQDITLENEYDDWTMLTICREGTILRIYENGNLNNTFNLGTIELFTGTLIAIQGNCRMSDNIIVPRNVSAEGVEYRYNDMIENQGNSTCPIY